MKKSLFQNIFTNLGLSLIKLAAGIIGCNSAMISDAAHSFSDVLSTVIVLIGLKISAKKADKDHPYGHERFECVAAVILSMILILTAVLIGKAALDSITSGAYMENQTASYLPIAAALLSIIVKEIMFQRTMVLYKKTNLVSIKADAWHHRSDALSSVGALIGTILTKCGILIADPIASLIITLFIVKVAIDIFIDATNKLTDKACDEETETAIWHTAEATDGVGRIDKMKTRQFGNRIYMDIEIAVDGDITLNRAHEIAQAVHDNIEREYQEVKHCMVHVNPIL